MLNMNYVGDSTIYPVEFKTISDNVVELKGDFPVLSVGFILSRPKHKDNWNYKDFTTVYREISGGVQFSSDGSVYVVLDPIPESPNVSIEPYEPTHEELAEMEQKRKEASAIPTNAELSTAVMELAENISDIEDAIAEIGNMIS